MNRQHINGPVLGGILLALILVVAGLANMLIASTAQPLAAAPVKSSSTTIPSPVATEPLPPLPSAVPSRPPAPIGSPTAVGVGSNRPEWGGCTSLPFVDVSPSDYFYDPVEFLCGRSGVYGYQNPGEAPCPYGVYPCFLPYNSATRRDLIRAVVASEDHWRPLAHPVTPSFADVPDDGYWYDLIETAFAKGIISGYPCGGPGEPCPGRYFRPTNNLTRGQAAKVITLAEKWYLSSPSSATFRDVLVGTTFFDYVETAYRYGLIGGYPCGGPSEPCPGLYYRPDNLVLRGQMSKIDYLADEGNYRHFELYPGTNNWYSNGWYGTPSPFTMEPRGFLQIQLTPTSPYVYEASGKSLQWSFDALQYLQNNSYSSDIVFHAFKANTNDCPNTAATNFTSDFSGSMLPDHRSTCFGPENEVRFRVAAPNIIWDFSAYHAVVWYTNNNSSEKSEIGISNYYNGILNRPKDDLRKGCFYNGVVAWLDLINSACHQ